VLSISGETTVSVSGKVLKPDGTPLKKCIVSLRKLKMKDTTDSNGKYSFIVNSTAIRDNCISLPAQSHLSLNSTKLNYTVTSQGFINVTIIDLKGQLVHTWKSGQVFSGYHVFPIAELIPGTIGQGMYLMRLQTEQEIQTFSVVKSGNSLRFTQSVGNNSNLIELGSKLAKTAAAVDTIEFKATGYISKAYTLSKYIINCEDVTLEEEDDEEDITSIPLSSSLLKGKWACIFYNQDGCESYVTMNNYQISNMTLAAAADGVQFSGTWGTYSVAGGIIDNSNLLLIIGRDDIVMNSRDIRLIALTQSHPTALLAGSVFSGVGVIGRFNLTTGLQVCQGSFEFMMVRDFTAIGGSSTSAGSTFNPKTSGFESSVNNCTTRYLNCSKACSIGTYGLDDTDRYSACIAKCNDEKRTCEKQ
jgi:hypothetical protein